MNLSEMIKSPTPFSDSVFKKQEACDSCLSAVLWILVSSDTGGHALPVTFS